MTPSMYAASAGLVLVALAFVAGPLFRHRKERGIAIALPLVIIALPLGVAAVYSVASNYPWGQQPAVADISETKQPPVDEMIIELEKRLETQPDLEGYVLLGRSYMSLQRYADAADAWHRAWELSKGESPEIALNYAEALVLADRRTLQTSAADLLDGVLEKMPNDPRALWYGGLSAAARQLDELAIERFTLLMQADLPDEMRKVVQNQLAQLGAAAAMADMDAAADAGKPVITATVSIVPELSKRIPAGAQLFVFARDGDKPGPPLAVKRLGSAEMPVTARLSDADAMVAGMTLESATEPKIVARISVSGNPIAAAGDFYGEVKLQTLQPGNNDVAVVIDKVVE